ncbi:aldo/keto reductase [Saccharopolyspora erythraea]|uniref:aldo/keto reductase n=1 Tax=Saccharopolyspora erythraea TaxID=1836 RepID=UPI001BAB233F|nr:aldo/keto reductase [Saccharopolyspora erythraea]QUH02173.1 aldo/keto reductase [Saccharopolyspora erythraea]
MSALGVEVADPIPGERDESDIAAAVAAAADGSITFIDITGPHRSETVVRRVLSRRREQLVLSAGFGERTDRLGRTIPGQARPDACMRAVDRSLRRLGTDHIDLYSLRRHDPSTPVEETVSTLGELAQAGKIRWIGLPGTSGKMILRAQTVHAVTAVSSSYSPMQRQPEHEVLPVCRRLGIAFLARHPLGEHHGPRGYAPAHEQLLQAVLGPMAAALGITTTQLALAWLLDKGLIPMPTALNLEDVRNHARATDLDIAPGPLREIDALLAPRTAGPQRSPGAPDVSGLRPDACGGTRRRR